MLFDFFDRGSIGVGLHDEMPEFLQLSMNGVFVAHADENHLLDASREFPAKELSKSAALAAAPPVYDWDNRRFLSLFLENGPS